MKPSTTGLRGMSLIEVTVVLLVMGVLAGTLTPVVAHTVRGQRLVRARNDVEAIRDAILMFSADVEAGGLALDGSVVLGLQEPVLLAVSNGDIPSVGPDGDTEWLAPVDFEAVDFLENHFSRNQPGGDPERGYKNWRGAYLLAPIGPDPWGNRYMVNSVYFWTPSGYRYDTVVLSAGPNGQVDSRFTQDGFVPGNDDVVAIVSTGKHGDP